MSQVRTPADFPRLWRGLVRRVEELELAVRSRRPVVVGAVGSGTTGPLGGAWQAIPGLEFTLDLRAGQHVSLDANLFMDWTGGEVHAFWRVDFDGAGHWPTAQALARAGGQPVGSYSGSDGSRALLANHTATYTGPHTFRVYAAGTSNGYVQGQWSYARVTSY